jgi:hypothetical protein
MPRKPKQEKKTITVIVNGTPIAVVLHPPTGSRRSWYAYWNGLVTSKSTGQSDLEEAMKVATDMVQSGGKRSSLGDVVLSDEEFEAIQRAHFGRVTDDRARLRAELTLASCMDAIAAFREITGIKPVSLATPDDCSAFQRLALTMPKKWRLTAPEGRLPPAEYTEDARARRQELDRLHSLDALRRYSSNSVLKWSRTLQAAFERANRNAQKRKCVRGVVPEDKLLEANPWNRFTWIRGARRPIRQFDGAELLAFLHHFETEWGGVSVVRALAKVFLWSSGRRLETATLKWDGLRVVGDEYHFEMVGKWDVVKWFRVPEDLYRELHALRTESPYVFAAYPDQLRRFYEQSNQLTKAKQVRHDFDPENVANWFYKRVVKWSASLPKGHATTHIFRKTSLQYARAGEDINRTVAQDAKVSRTVLMTNYVKETDEQMRAASNRIFNRILASLSPDVARRYGYLETAIPALEQQLHAAVAAKNWALVAELTARLLSKSEAS